MPLTPIVGLVVPGPLSSNELLGLVLGALGFFALGVIVVFVAAVVLEKLRVKRERGE